MNVRQGAALLVAVALVGGPARAADHPAPGDITVTAATGAVHVLTPQDIEAIPPIQLTVPVEPGHGPPNRTYEGPLLWSVLERAGVLEGVKFRDHPHQALIATGSDGDAVILALGELSPEFEGKQVLLADRMDGRPLEPGHFRLVVPGDKRAGRSARDIVRLRITTPD